MADIVTPRVLHASIPPEPLIPRGHAAGRDSRVLACSRLATLWPEAPSVAYDNDVMKSTPSSGWNDELRRVTRLKLRDRRELASMSPADAQAAVDAILHPHLWRVAKPAQLDWPGDLADDDEPTWGPADKTVSDDAGS